MNVSPIGRMCFDCYRFYVVPMLLARYQLHCRERRTHSCSVETCNTTYSLSTKHMSINDDDIRRNKDHTHLCCSDHDSRSRHHRDEDHRIADVEDKEKSD